LGTSAIDIHLSRLVEEIEECEAGGGSVRYILGNSADYSRGREDRKNEFDEHLICCWNA